MVDWGLIDTTMEDVYYVCIKKLDARFCADDNVQYQQHMFRHMALLSRESADKFLVRLKKNRQDIVILARNQLIEKLPDI